MPRYIRSFIPGGTCFFTVTLADRSSCLLADEIEGLRDAYTRVCRRHPFRTVAICVLPDHLHAIWELPPADADAPMRWGQIKRGFSSVLESTSTRTRSQTARREKGIWQRRYWEHQIRDEDDFALHVDYIHWNPVKHGLVRQVRDWPFSSFHRWVRCGDLPPGWGLVEAGDGGRFGEPLAGGAAGGAQASLHTLRAPEAGKPAP
jgi:putative transposase